MIGRTNAGGIGGASAGAVKSGTIVVTYPAGATCTVTGNGKTHTALDTSGAAAFVVEPGTWTVTASQDDKTASESVTVPAGGWVEVELLFALYIIENGVVQEPPGFSTNTVSTSPGVTQGDGFYQIVAGANAAGLATDIKIDLSRYSRIRMECNVTKAVSSSPFNGVMLGYIDEVTTGSFNNFKPIGYSTHAIVENDVIMTLDISAIDATTLYRVFVCGGCSYGNGSVVQIKNLWLE